MRSLLQPIEDVIRHRVILTITGKQNMSVAERRPSSHHSLQEACLSVGQQERPHVLNNHAVAALSTVLQPPKISHHSHQRNKSVCPHPNPVNPPGYGGGQNHITNKLKHYSVYNYAWYITKYLPACFTAYIHYVSLPFQGSVHVCLMYVSSVIALRTKIPSGIQKSLCKLTISKGRITRKQIPVGRVWPSYTT